MPVDDNNNGEPNVEGLVGEFLGRTPFENPRACREMVRLYASTVEILLANRKERLDREEDEEEDEDEDEDE